nr:10414_t:CDS:2 [Entrophospora candida]
MGMSEPDKLESREALEEMFIQHPKRAYPKTPLCTMFHERNDYMLKSIIDGNEYFLDRDGKTFPLYSRVLSQWRGGITRWKLFYDDDN